jgi:uncharacterized membrane protein YdjX (TVP38/TMEM64 family)
MERSTTQNFKWTKLLPLLILLLGLVAFFYFRLYTYLSFASLKTYHDVLQNAVKNNFILAALVFGLIYALLTAISAPGAIFLTIFGGFLFGPIWGTLLVAIGATIGAAIIFIAARTALRDFLHQKIGVWLKKISAGFKNNAISYMLFLRLVPLFPFWLVNIVPAFLEIDFSTFVWTTFVGILPGTFVYIMLGNGIGVLFAQGKTPNLGIIFKPAILIPIVGLGVLALVPIIVKRMRQHGRKN